MAFVLSLSFFIAVALAALFVIGSAISAYAPYIRSLFAEARREDAVAVGTGRRAQQVSSSRASLPVLPLSDFRDLGRTLLMKPRARFAAFA